MKTMTCKQLGGPCDLELRGETADEVINLQDQHPDDRLASLPDGHILRTQELRARLYCLVLARQVHPEEDAAHLGSGLALSELVFADTFSMPHAAARSELQE